VSVWAYSISAVKQDEFDDVDAEALRLDKRQLVSIEDQTNATALSSTSPPASASAPPFTPAPASATPASPSRPPSNLLTQFKPTIIDRFAQLRHPQDGNLIVWGAPPVNRVGSIGDRRDAPWRDI
jgi:cytochrome c oxidase assembly factor 3, fungi type